MERPREPNLEVTVCWATGLGKQSILEPRNPRASPNHLEGSYAGLAEASRDTIVPAFPDSRESQAKRTSLNERSNSIEPTESKTVNLVRCPMCSRSFEDPANLTYHIKMAHGIAPEETSLNERSSPIELTESKTINLVRCSDCDGSFEEPENLAYHIEHVHTIGDRPKNTDTRIFIPLSIKSLELLRCRHCHKAFEHASNMEYHIRRNHIIQCPSCSRSVEGPENLAYHMSQSHPARPKYYIYVSQNHRGNLIKCPECNNKFQSSENLAWHMKQAHLIIMLRKCPQCHRTFEARFELESHFKVSHPNSDLREISEPQLPYYACVKCDKTFSCQESLSTHEQEKHGSGHPVVSTSRKNSQQIEGPSQDSDSEKAAETQFLTKNEQEKCDRALAIRLQEEEEEEEEKERALRKQEDERDEHRMREPGLAEQASGVLGTSIQDKNVSGVEEAQIANPEHTSTDQLSEVSMLQGEQKGNAVNGSLSSNVRSPSVLSEQNSPAVYKPKEGRGLSSSSPNSSQLAEASPDTLPVPIIAAATIMTNERSRPPVNTIPTVRPTEESSGSLIMKLPTRIAVDETIPRMNDLHSTAVNHSSPKVAKTLENEIIPPATKFQSVPTRTPSPASTLSSDTLSNRLSMFFQNRPNTGYSDAEIAEISRLLKYSVSNWSKVPRTYIILRTIDSLNILEDLLAIGFTDHWFPVTPQALPQLKSLTLAIRLAIVDHQGIILTKSIDLEKGAAGEHQHFPKGEFLPFQTLGILGTGGFGQVDRVRSTISYKEYARKRVRRRNVFGNDPAAAVKAFISEVEILKRLKHRHIVEFTGSYTDPTCFGIIMSPVAEMDLAKYLSIAKPEHNPTLRTYFGCLTAALQYLHDNKIRHKDIKPQNILVDHGNVLLTDFGLSRDSTGVGSTTSGLTSLTPRYCAPEVAMHDSRNSSSDIWSLGCVFLEMFVVLKGHNVDWMKYYFAHHGSGEFYVRTNPRATVEMISELEQIEPTSDNRVIEWVLEMLQVDRKARPTAAELITSITGQDEYGEFSSAFCGMCCSCGDESSEAEDSMDKELFGVAQP